MIDPIPDPVSGKHVLDWAVPVTRSLNALRDKVGAKARNERDRRPTQQPQPFEVRWDGSLNNSSGGWKIYLPTEHLLSYGDIDVATSDISGATAIQDDDNNDTSWFSLDDVDTSADHVWLVVTVTESNGSIESVEAELAAEEGQAATGEIVRNICVAEISYTEPEEENAPSVVEIRQSLVGALHLGGAAGEPVTVSADGPFSPVYDTEGEDADVVTGFQNCYWQNGGVTVLMSGMQPIPGTDGFIALKTGATPSTSGTATLECYASFAALQAAQRGVGYFIVPLYRVADSKITLDMRRMPIVFATEVLP